MKSNYSTYRAIKDQLMEIFKTETFPGNLLPSEAALADKLGISLVTLRAALLMLAKEGYVTKRHGIGNFVHPSAVDFENQTLYFIEALRKSGYTTRMEIVYQRIRPAPKETAAALRLNEGDPVLRTWQVFYADEKPAIATEGTMAIDTAKHTVASLIYDGAKPPPELEYVHTQVWRHLHRRLAHALIEYFPLGLPEHIAPYLQLAPGTPIIGAEQLFFDVEDVAVLHNLHYFYPNIIKVRTMQNWDLIG